MSVKIIKADPLPPKTEENAPKRKRGRPHGSRDKQPRKLLPVEKRKGRVFSDVKRLENSAQKVVEALERTAEYTEEQLLERAAEAPEAVGGFNRGMDSITDERAERAALAYRLSIRGLTVAQIAEQMDVSETTAKGYLETVRKVLRLDPKQLDVGFHMGESLAFFQEIRQMALLHASNASNSVMGKLNAMRVALEAENQKNQFLTKIGVYSPVVIERIERWLVSTTEQQILDTPTAPKKINLAAELGRLMAERSRTIRSEEG